MNPIVSTMKKINMCDVPINMDMAGTEDYLNRVWGIIDGIK